MTDIFEGSIIRVARRLDELMQQLANAAEVVGDETLAQRFRESNETLRRGIMFSASLYL
jgi:ATP-dependent RNA helicase DOB1